MQICQQLNSIVPIECVSNESFGMTIERIICEIYNLDHNIKSYRVSKRIVNNEMIYNLFKKSIKSIFRYNPKPIQYTGEKSNPVDFQLQNNKTLSVKSNTSNFKVAPQNNQKTIKQFYNDISNIDHVKSSKLMKHLMKYLVTYYDELEANEILYNILDKIYDTKNVHHMDVVRRISIFTLFNKRDTYLEYFIDNLFDTDYLLYLYCDDLTSENFNPDSKCVNNLVLFTPTDIKEIKSNFKNLINKKENIIFTQNNRKLNTDTFLQKYLKFLVDNINFSSTLKIKHNGTFVTIGEIQYHKKRDNIVFRFDMVNLLLVTNKSEFIPCSHPSYKMIDACENNNVVKLNKNKTKCCHKKSS